MKPKWDQVSARTCMSSVGLCDRYVFSCQILVSLETCHTVHWLADEAGNGVVQGHQDIWDFVLGKSHPYKSYFGWEGRDIEGLRTWTGLLEQQDCGWLINWRLEYNVLFYTPTS